MYEEEKRLIEFRDRFSNLLEKYLDAIYDERKFRGLLSDYFPEENWLSHLLMALYKAGIVEEIENSKSMDFESFLRFKKKLVNNYRTQEQDAEWAVGMWFECYGDHILKKTNNVERYIYRNVAINSKESIELIEEIIEISKGKSCGENPLKYLHSIFKKSSRYPNALKKLYLLYPILEQYDTDEEKYSEWMYVYIYGKESICEYDDYMDLYNALLDLKYNVDYYFYGALLLNGECAEQEAFNVKLNKENAYKWCAYYYEEIKKRKIKNITSTIFSIANLEFALGAVYLQGKYIERDVKKATYCWKSMLKRDIEEYSNIEDMGIMLKCIGAAYIGEKVTVTVQGDECEIKLRKNLKLGYEFLKKSVDNGNVASIFLLAGMYEKGEYVEKDFFYAVQLYKKAKEGGDEEAFEWIEKNKTIVELLNEIIEISQSTEYDDTLWSRIYEVFIKAPQFPEVLRCLHLLYPVIKNYDTEEYCYSRNIFVRLFIKTTVCGYEDYFVLFNKLADLSWDGDYYLYGILVGGSIIEWDEKTLELTYSLENSIKWFAYFYELIKRKNISYVRFSNAGEEIVEFELGCAYAQGLYLEKNTKKGYQYWKEILRKENNELGDLRRTGEILSMIGGMYLGRTCKIRIPDDKIYYIKIRKNGKESFKYLLRASELGNIQASLLLAEMYEKGNYVERDIKKAYKLYQKAAKEDNEDAKEWIRKYEQKKYSDLKFDGEELVDIDEDGDEDDFIELDKALEDDDEY